MPYEEDDPVRAAHLMEQLISTLSLRQYDLSREEKQEITEDLSRYLANRAEQSAMTPLQPGEAGLVIRGVASFAIEFVGTNVKPSARASMRDDIKKWEKRMLELEARSNTS